MLGLLGKGGGNRNVLFVGIEQENVSLLRAGRPLVIAGSDFCADITEDFEIGFAPTLVEHVRRMSSLGLNAQTYKHSVVATKERAGRRMTFVGIDAVVLGLLEKGNPSIFSTAGVGWTTDVFLFYRASLREPGDIEAARAFLDDVLQRMRNIPTAVVICPKGD